MLFQGEEYGEVAPFQFFSDHIDAEIAAATRAGRRREFAFARDVPDPEDPATFERSKLTRAGAPAGMRELYVAALALRARLNGAEADAHADGPRLTVRRGPRRILANFGAEPWPLDGEPVLTAGPVRDRALEPLSGAVL
jgi:maltooligosyltrehalose trehalohydrolase